MIDNEHHKSLEDNKKVEIYNQISKYEQYLYEYRKKLKRHHLR